jgi:cystathionine beta-lyase/cystathionine gamma-synthase
VTARRTGLPSHPQHELAKRQMSGFGGMITFFLKGGLAESRTFLETLKVRLRWVSAAPAAASSSRARRSSSAPRAWALSSRSRSTRKRTARLQVLSNASR